MLKTKTRLHVRLDERTRDRLQTQTDFMSRVCRRRITVGQFLKALMETVKPQTMLAVRDYIRREVTE